MGLPIHLPHRTGAVPHRAELFIRLGKAEGLADWVTLGLIALFAGAIVYALLTTTGSSPWY
jgi:hypothetical protein